MGSFDKENPATYWQQRYDQGDTPWDIGAVAPAIKQYINQLDNKQLRILIPGAGHAHEAGYLFQKGFKNTIIVDIAAAPLKDFSQRFPLFPKENLVHADFFKLDPSYDLILEQTFFCAVNPDLRQAYVQQMHRLLEAEGKLVGLLFDAPLYQDHPPFGGSQKEYRKLFSPYFSIEKLEPSTASVAARTGRELFMILHPKNKKSPH